MDKKIYFNALYDYYASLFTEKQRAYFEDYYFKDFSLAEIAENNQVSRNAVHGQIKIVEEKLLAYEEALKLYQKSQKIRVLIRDLDPEVQDKIEKWI